MTRSLTIALVHHPILDAQGGIVTTAVTNLDVHDLARSARTYGCEGYVIVHPVTAQRELVGRILDHWKDGSSGRRIPARKEALSKVRLAASVEEAWDGLGGRDAVEVWVTSAAPQVPTVTFAEGRELLRGPGKPVLLLFGTGWGLAPSLMTSADRALESIRGVGSAYNHLSVRAACAIALDRLLGGGT